MATLVSQDPAAILEAVADAIEGGNTYRGSGTAFKGIPGLYPTDRFLRNAADSTQTASAAVDTTHVQVATPSVWPSGRWVQANAPPYFLLCTSGTVADQHRKITGYAYTAAVTGPPAVDAYGRFTVAPAFATAPQAADVFAVRQGFKRVPDMADIDDPSLGSPDGWDRFFHVSAMPGKVLNWFGNSIAFYETVLRLRLRIGKFGRLHDWTAAAMSNLAIMRMALVRREHYESTYTVALSPLGGEPTISRDDANKVVVQDNYRLVYQVRQDFA